jgi:hypothetical protein
MIAPASAGVALEALWQVMVELAEAANEEIVLGQRAPAAFAANTIAQYSSDLAEIARSATILARLATTP